MKTVVLSNQKQLDSFLAQGYRPDEFMIFCDNLEFSPVLARQNICPVELNELVIHDQWQRVNAWGCAAAAAWIRSARSGPKPLSYDFPSILYLYFSHNLVHMLKNYLYARWLVAKAKPECVVVFGDRLQKFYPAFSGNYFLNQFLLMVACQQNIPVVKLPDTSGKATSSEFGGGSIFRKAQDFLRSFVQNINALACAPSKASGVWVYGSLRHSQPVLLEFKKRRIPFFLYDRHFNFEKFFFALQNSVPYVTPFTKPKTTEADRERFAAEKYKEIIDSFDTMIPPSVFDFDGISFAPFVREHLLCNLDPFLKKMAEAEVEYRSVISAIRISALLTEEDYARRGGFLCAFVKKTGVPIFSLSHSATATDFEVPEDLCCVGQSTTFVNSEFERAAYTGRGWNPECFVMSGVPRYGFVLRKKTDKTPLRQKHKLRLLFCANRYVFNRDQPDRHGYLGHMLYAMSEIVRPTAEIFFETIKKNPDVEVVLKPHGSMGIREWQVLVKKFELQDRIKIIRSECTIDRFFDTSDAMIVSYWSTAMIEAAHFGLPIIYMDFKKLGRPSVLKFEEAGLCEIVRDGNGLQAALTRMRQGEAEKRQKETALKQYFLGENPTGAAVRVANEIIQRLGPAVMTDAPWASFSDILKS